MASALGNPPRCPNCGVAKVRCFVTPDLKDVIAVPQDGLIWKCIDCKKICCSACFGIDYRGDGRTFFCPHCKTRMTLPKPGQDPHL
ncbi:MAG: hypothetical protein AAB345_00590 [Patescibacteria group bacterium]